MNAGTPTPDNPSLAAELVQWAQSEAAAAHSRDAASAADKAVATAGTDPDYLPASEIEAFVSMSHQDILNAVEDMAPGVMHTWAEAWQKNADAAMFNTMGLNSKVQTTLNGGWAGKTATAISNATRTFVEQMTDMHNVTQSVSSRIHSAAYGAETVRGAVPSIPADPGKPAVPGAENPAVVIGQLTAASDAVQEARHAMIEYYVPTYQSAGQKVPVYVPPAGPASEADPKAPGVTEHDSVAGPSAQTRPDKKPAGGTDTQQHAPHRNDTTTPAADDEPSGQHNTSPAADAASADQNATTAASVSSSATPNSAPNSFGSNSASGTGSDVGNSGAVSFGEAIPNAPGRSIPGVTRTPGVGVAAGASRTATAGTPVVPGAGVPNKERKGNGDKEHKGRPELLVHRQNKKDLVGDPILATPPVFGAKTRAAEENLRDKRPPADEDDHRR